jgi:hypothetical protein
MDGASLFNQPVAAKRDAREVHKAEDCHDVDEGEALIQLAAGLWPWLWSKCMRRRCYKQRDPPEEAKWVWGLASG